MSELFPDKKIMAITGKIGSGKSTALKILEKVGIDTIDCDALVNELYEPKGLGTQRIHTFFGATYLKKDGSVSRKKLLRPLLKNPKKWEILNRMIHPLVAEKLKRSIRASRAKQIAIEIQWLEPKRFMPFFDEVWEIETEENIRIKRIKQRKLKMEAFHAINAQQEELKPLAPTITIKNNSTKSDLERSLLKQL